MYKSFVFYKKQLSTFLGLIFSLFIIFNYSIKTNAAEGLFDKDEYIIVIDPGHGGENEGTIENGFLEKEMTLQTALTMKDILSKFDNVTVYLTRETDVDLSLKQRAEIAKSVNADFLFSLHYNASVKHDLFGSEVWISAFPPYNAYGYIFGKIQLMEMENYNLFIRGIKTKLNDKGTDYYGIIRQSVALEIPAVIIEHCHVDEDRDNIYLADENSHIEAFGASDAYAVAKFLGLKSETLNLDFSDQNTYASQIDSASTVAETLLDDTPPEFVELELTFCDYEAKQATFKVTAKDNESTLIYYAYSIDGGNTYSKLYPWPGSDTLDYNYDSSFDLDLVFDEIDEPKVIVRAYNMFDAFTESDVYEFEESFKTKEIEVPAISEDIVTVSLSKDEVPDKKYDSFISFLVIVFLLVLLTLITVIVLKIISNSKRRKTRKK